MKTKLKRAVTFIQWKKTTFIQLHLPFCECGEIKTG